MRKKWIVVVSVFVLIILGFSLHSIAGCKSDCREEYESEIESCKGQYDDPGEAGMLKKCLDDAKTQYQSCMDECDS